MGLRECVGEVVVDGGVTQSEAAAVDVDVEGKLCGGIDINIGGYEDPALQTRPNIIVFGEGRGGLLAVE